MHSKALSKNEFFSKHCIPSQICVLLLFFSISITREKCKFIVKDTLTQVFSCKFCEIFENTFFIKHLRMATSETVIGSSQGNTIRNLKEIIGR